MRIVLLLIFLGCAGLISYALYLQEIEGLLPCPLCVAQRIAYWCLGLTALITYLHNPSKIGLRLYSSLMLFFALLGATVAGRHAWLIRYPESFECGISPEEAFLNALPLAEWWPAMFEANGDCAEVNWQLLSLTIPDWSLVAFLLLSGVIIFLLLTKKVD